MARPGIKGLNGLICKKLPNGVFVGQTMLEVGLCSTVINFNNGLMVLNVMNITLT